MIDFNAIKMISSTIGFVINISKAIYNSHKLIRYIIDNPKETAKKLELFLNNKYTIMTLKFFIIIVFISLTYSYFLIAGLVWLKYKLSMLGLSLAFITLFISSAFTAIFFSPIVKELFFVSKNKDDPFTVIR